MFRIIISFVLIIFLFSGILGTATILFKSKTQTDSTITASMYVKEDPRLTIKEIEAITAANNYRFTSANALR
mgnify:FL=1